MAPTAPGPPPLERGLAMVDPAPARSRLPWILVVILAVALVVVSVLALRAHHQDTVAEGERPKIEAVAERFSERFVTYDYAELDRAREAVRQLATPRLMAEYDQAFSGQLARALQATQATSSGQVTAVLTGRPGPRSAMAVAVVDVVAEGRDKAK